MIDPAADGLAREQANKRFSNDPPQPHPNVRGRCPSCGAASLFLGSNGYVTCSVIGCKEPGAATDLLADPKSVIDTLRAEKEQAQEAKARMWVEARYQQPCVICGWPRPLNNEHNICECCGFQPGYDDPTRYQWNGAFWAACIEPKPKILTHFEAALVASEDARAKAEGELRSIDAVLARRPALDLPTRWQNIEKAISFAHRTDEAERKLQAAEARAEQAERERDEWQETVRVLQQPHWCQRAETAEQSLAHLRAALTTLHMECLDEGHSDSGDPAAACRHRGMGIRCGICMSLDDAKAALASHDRGDI